MPSGRTGREPPGNEVYTNRLRLIHFIAMPPVLIHGKLLQSDPFLPPLAHNMDPGRRVKMSAQNECVRITMLVDELGAGLDGQGFVCIRLLAPLRFSDLYWMHHHIPGDEGFLAVGAEVNATMARRVARRWDEHDFIIDTPRILHPFYLSRLDNWHDILLDDGLIFRARFVSPMLPFT